MTTSDPQSDVFRPLLAEMYFDWDELDLLARLVESVIDPPSPGDSVWQMLSELRTQLRDAQQQLWRPPA